jgi:hypothetical protein
MRPITQVVLERLRRGLLSRNRHFALFRRPEAKDALRIHQFLRSLERDLQPHAGKPVAVSIRPSGRGGEEVTLCVVLPHLRASRTCRLSRTELAILFAQPELRALVALPDPASALASA